MAKKKTKNKSKPKKRTVKSAEYNSGEVIYLGTPPIFMWDRSALIVWNKQPFVDWLNALPDNERGHTYTVADTNAEPSLYLLPPYGFDDELEELLNLVAPIIFVKQLEAWCTEPDWWPKDLEQQSFADWFHYEVTSIVSDLVDNEPVREEY